MGLAVQQVLSVAHILRPVVMPANIEPLDRRAKVLHILFTFGGLWLALATCCAALTPVAALPTLKRHSEVETITQPIPS